MGGSDITRRVALAGLAIPCDARASGVAAPAPPHDPAPMAPSFPHGAIWPVLTEAPDAHVVPALFADGTAQGAALRRFNAPRPAARADNPTRRHVGVDLAANAGDRVVAIADGVVAAFYPFLTARTGETTYALLVAHGACTVLYGEIRAAAFVQPGDPVTGGQRLGRVSDTAQLHIETYVRGVRRNTPWPQGAPTPGSVLNPTQMLLDLARDGMTVAPR
ncbi:MAG: M23 family metallopeptidase [Hyphomonadaceae bacterium]|nr:M23 family metallopeptidase [Hyphomonadaceae bacterium]